MIAEALGGSIAEASDQNMAIASEERKSAFGTPPLSQLSVGANDDSKARDASRLDDILLSYSLA